MNQRTLREALARLQQGAGVEVRLCSTLGAISALPGPVVKDKLEAHVHQ